MRIFVAACLGLLGFLVYVGAVATLADWVEGANWAVQVLYFVLAGMLWVPAAHYLILWAGRK